MLACYPAFGSVDAWVVTILHTIAINEISRGCRTLSKKRFVTAGTLHSNTVCCRFLLLYQKNKAVSAVLAGEVSGGQDISDKFKNNQ